MIGSTRVLLVFGEGCGAFRYRIRLSPLAQGEIVSGDRYCEVVQRNKGLWIYSARATGGKDVFVHISAARERV